MRISVSTPATFQHRSNRVIVIRNDVPSLFSRELTRQEEKVLDLDQLELEELKEQLEDAGVIFENQPTIVNFRIFREVIGRFVKKALSVAYRVEKKQGKRPSWTHEIVVVIDKAADELLNLVMQGQKDRITLAGRIANIKGMIVQISA